MIALSAMLTNANCVLPGLATFLLKVNLQFASERLLNVKLQQ